MDPPIVLVVEDSQHDTQDEGAYSSNAAASSDAKRFKSMSILEPESSNSKDRIEQAFLSHVKAMEDAKRKNATHSYYRKMRMREAAVQPREILNVCEAFQQEQMDLMTQQEKTNKKQEDNQAVWERCRARIAAAEEAKSKLQSEEEVKQHPHEENSRIQQPVEESKTLLDDDKQALPEQEESQLDVGYQSGYSPTEIETESQ